MLLQPWDRYKSQPSLTDQVCTISVIKKAQNVKIDPMNDNNNNNKKYHKIFILSSFKIIYVIQTKLMIYEDLIHYYQWLVALSTVTTLG